MRRHSHKVEVSGGSGHDAHNIMLGPANASVRVERLIPRGRRMDSRYGLAKSMHVGAKSMLLSETSEIKQHSRNNGLTARFIWLASAFAPTVTLATFPARPETSAMPVALKAPLEISCWPVAVPRNDMICRAAASGQDLDMIVAHGMGSGSGPTLGMGYFGFGWPESRLANTMVGFITKACAVMGSCSFMIRDLRRARATETIRLSAGPGQVQKFLFECLLAVHPDTVHGSSSDDWGAPAYLPAAGGSTARESVQGFELREGEDTRAQG